MVLKTLRDVSGLGDQLPALRGSALVMIDLQNTYREGVMQLAGVEPAIEQARQLLARARSVGAPIFHVRHDAGAGSPYDVTARIGAISDEVAPEGEEPVITKHYPNAFVGTDLHEKIEAAGVHDIIFAGFMTHMCINSSARGAFNLGLRPVVVASTTATRDLPAPDGSIVPAAALQTASLAALGDLFALIAPTVADIRD
jgi:nicotinamidase-related amidase